MEEVSKFLSDLEVQDEDTAIKNVYRFLIDECLEQSRYDRIQNLVDNIDVEKVFPTVSLSLLIISNQLEQVNSSDLYFKLYNKFLENLGDENIVKEILVGIKP